MDLRVQRERLKTEQELKELHQRKIIAAVLSFVDGKIATKPAALRALGLCSFKYRRSLDFKLFIFQMFCLHALSYD